jgi:hypothetical protein
MFPLGKAILMTFSTATIQGKVMWIGWKDKQGKQENRNTTTLWVNVPDKRSEKDDNGNHTKGTLYQVRVWDNQAITAQKYIEKFQTITITGSITGIDNYKEDNLKINMDFATILDYGYKQPKKNMEGTPVFVPMKEAIQEAIKKKITTAK